MMPEAADYLEKAQGDLADARKVSGIGLATVAARPAYFAAFHAAEAFIIERSGKVAKTHSGVRAVSSTGIDCCAVWNKFARWGAATATMS